MGPLIIFGSLGMCVVVAHKLIISISTRDRASERKVSGFPGGWGFLLSREEALICLRVNNFNEDSNLNRPSGGNEYVIGSN